MRVKKQRGLTLASTLHRHSLTDISFAVATLFILLMSASRLQAQQRTLTLPSMFHFDGTSHITLADSAALAPKSQITITGWIKPDFSVNNVTDTVLDKRDGCGFNRSYQLGVLKTYQSSAPGTIFFAASNANTDDLVSTVPIPNDGRFHHVGGTYDGTLVKVFLDGVLVGQGTHSGPISTTTDPAVIGLQAGCGDPTYADIGQVKILNYAVPDDQIMSDLPSGFALLNGGNSFVGDQNVNGVVVASSFVGNGSGLTGVTAQSANAANYAASAGTAGSAALATLATSAIDATNAANLGGIAPGSYARVDIGNAFTGNQNVAGNMSISGSSTTGSLVVGGGTPITKHLSMTFSLSLPSLKPSTCTTFVQSFPGASNGDTTALGVPNAMMTAGMIIYTAWASGSNAITIRACDLNPNGPQTTSVAGQIRVDLWKH